MMGLLGLGATYLGRNRCRFLVWAPFLHSVNVRILAPKERIVSLEKDARGYHQGIIEGVEPGTLYLYCLEGEKERPDPASRLQSRGVHGPSQVVDPHFPWKDHAWHNPSLRNYFIYELHVGTFTREGTFDAIAPHLERLKDLGITAIELMPVAQFPGDRNWGYDGVYPFSVQHSYGGHEGLKRLVNACHQNGLAVILDVVYNHLGPEGNYLRDFGPYFTDRYKTPWGSAVNFDGAYSDEVRSFFIENALYWIEEFHVDALRIDAVHAILDFSARPFLQELAEAVHNQAALANRNVYLIAESALNDTRLIRARELGGFQLEAQWNDDFHHALHTLLTGERDGYYEDFGDLRQLAKAYREGFVYSGEYSSYRRRKHGNSSTTIPADRFVVFAQNHDQVGNRMRGERLTRLVSLEALKLAAGTVILSPFVPLFFMGEEYGEEAPFPYFISHSDPHLVEAVRRGRKEEFAAFKSQGEPPEPQDEGTFLSAKLNPSLLHESKHRILFDFYKELISLRKNTGALNHLSKENMEVVCSEKDKVLFIRRWTQKDEVAIIFYFGEHENSFSIPLPAGLWEKRFDSAEERWQGPGGKIGEEIRSDGEVFVAPRPHSLTLLSRSTPAHRPN